MSSSNVPALRVHDATEVPAVVRAQERPAERGQMDYAGLLAFAKELMPSGILPEHIKNPGMAVAIILTGQELGMQPMRAIRSLVMVKGKVTENADSQLARFKTDGGRAAFRTLTETEAVLWLRHPNGDEHTETFTMADAKAAGLTKPDRNGENMFMKYPKAMLRSRVITAGLKSLGWEGGAGVYDPAELASVQAVPEAQHAVEDSKNLGADFGPFDGMSEDRRFCIKGPFFGTPLGKIESPVLHRYRLWIEKKRYEKSDPAMLEHLYNDLLVVLQNRGEQIVPWTASDAADSESAIAHGSGPTSFTPEAPRADDAPGAAYRGDPYPEDPKEKYRRWNAPKLQKHVLELARHEAVSPEKADAILLHIDSGTQTKLWLEETARELEANIAAYEGRVVHNPRAVSIGTLPDGV